MLDRSPWFNEDHAIFQTSIRRFIQEEMVPHEERWSKQQHADRDVWQKAGAVGMLLPSIPEEYGGAGGNFGFDAIIALEQSYAIAPSVGLNVHSGITAHYILRYGSEEQKQRWLPKMARGEMIGAIAMSEPAAGSDLKAITTKAERQGDHYIINGSKTFITNGYMADLILLVVKTDLAAGARGTSIVVIETADLQGFRRGKILEKIGQKGQDTAELFFDNVKVPVENLLGHEEGKGFYQLMQQLPQERMLIALGSLGSIKRALYETIDYVKQRKVFGQFLADFQNTRFKLAEMQSIERIATTFVDNCMARVLRSELSNEDAAIAKWWLSDQCCRVADDCLQLHGGYGYVLDYPIARIFANTRVLRIYGGSNEIMKEIIGRKI